MRVAGISGDMSGSIASQSEKSSASDNTGDEAVGGESAIGETDVVDSGGEAEAIAVVIGGGLTAGGATLGNSVVAGVDGEGTGAGEK